MADIEVLFEVLENNVSENTSNAQQDNERKKRVLDSMKQIAEFFAFHNQTTRVQDVLEHLSESIHQLLRACGDVVTDVRVAADDALKKVIKSRIDAHSDKILDGLFKGMKLPNKNSQKAAFTNFASVCNYILPQKCRSYVISLLPQLISLFKTSEPVILIALGESMEGMLHVLGYYFEERECKELLDVVLPLLSSDSVEVRRGASQCVRHMCQFIPQFPISDVCSRVSEIALDVIEEENNTIVCQNKDTLQGCIQTLSQVLEVLIVFDTRCSVTLNQHFANIVCDLLVPTLSFVDQQILTASFSLLSRLLSTYLSLCQNWKRDKATELVKKILNVIKTSSLVTVRSSALETTEHCLKAFPTLTIEVFGACNISLQYLLDLSVYHDDYLMRGRASILLGCIISTCISNHISFATLPLLSTDIQLKYDLETRNYTHMDLLHILIMHLVTRARIETNSLCIKLLCIACGKCLPACLYVPEYSYQVPQLLQTFINLDDGFWGVRVEILMMLQGFNYTLLEYYDRKRMKSSLKDSYSSRSITQILVEEVIWKYIADENVRVREQACAALITILPHLNGIQESNGNNNFFVERHSDEYESQLLKQIAANNLFINQSLFQVRNHELVNIVVVMRRCISILNDSKADKNKLSGLLEIMGTIVRHYGLYDENIPGLINYKKAVCATGQDIFSFFSIELLDKMLDFVKFSEVSNDLQVHGLIVEIIGLLSLELDAKHDTNGINTDAVLRYLLFMLEVIHDLDTNPNVQWNEKFYPFAQTMSSYVYERLFTNIQKSLKASSDIISQLRRKLLRALYFLIHSGEPSVIEMDSTVILLTLQRQVQKDKENTILCTQELFVALFNENSNMKRYEIDSTRSATAIAVNNITQSLFDQIFSYCKLENKDTLPFSAVPFVTETVTRSPRLLKLVSLKKGENVQQVLDLFEPIVAAVVRSFKFTHSHALQNVIIYMFKRIVSANIEIKRWDKDGALIKQMLKIMNEMQTYLVDKIADQTLFQIMDFLSTALFSAGSSIEVDEKTIMAAFNAGLVSKNWDTAIFFQSLTPMMIRSYLHSYYNPQKQLTEEETNKLKNRSIFITDRESLAVDNDGPAERFSKQLLKLFIDNIRHPESLRVLSIVLSNLSIDPNTCKLLTTALCDKLVRDYKLKLIINWLRADKDLEKVSAFFESLSVSVDSSSSQLWCKVALAMLQNEALMNPQEKISTPGITSDDIRLFKGVVVMKFLNKFRYVEGDATKRRQLHTDLTKFILFALDRLRSASLQKMNRELVVKALREYFVHVSAVLECDTDAVKYVEVHKLTPYLRTVLTEQTTDLLIYSSLISICLKAAVGSNAFGLSFALSLASLLESIPSDDTHTNNLIVSTTFLPITYLMAKQKSIIFEVMQQAGFSNSAQFWNLVLKYEKEPIISQFIANFSVEIGDQEASRRSELIIGLVQMLRTKVKEYSSRHLYLNDLRKVVRFVKTLPPLQQVLDIFTKQRMLSEKSPFFFHKKIYNDVIGFISSKDSTLDVTESNSQQNESLSDCESNVLSEAKKYLTGITTNENAVASLIARFSPFSEQSPLKYAPQVVGSMSASCQKQILEAANLTDRDRNRLSDAITYLTSIQQLEVFFNYFYDKIEAELANILPTFTTFASLTTDIIKLIEKHVELSDASKQEATYCTTVKKSLLIRYYCKLIEVFYNERLEANTVDIADVDILLHVSSNILDFVGYSQNADPALAHDWNQFVIHMTKLLIDMTTITSSNKIEFLTGSEKLDTNVKIIIAKTYGVSNDEHRGFHIGNIIPFVSVKHLSEIRKISVKICQHYPTLAYRRYLSASEDSYPRLEDSYVQMLTLMINEISCDGDMFKQVWNLGFELSQMVISEPAFEDMQLSTLKLLTNMLCIIRFNAGTEQKRPTGNSRQLALQALLETVDQFLLKNAKHKLKDKRLFIHVDKAYAMQIFTAFMKEVDRAIKAHKKQNPVFFKELLKSITLIMSRNPSMFLTSDSIYTFRWIYDLFKEVHAESLLDEDWLVKQYAVLGLSKSFSIVALQDDKFLNPPVQQNNQIVETPLDLIVKVLQDALIDPHTRLCANLSILILIQHKINKAITKLIPFIVDNFQKWITEENQTIHLLRLQIRMITSIVCSYGETRSYDLPKKVADAFMGIAQNSRTPLDVVLAVFEALERMLQTGTFNAAERKLLDSYSKGPDSGTNKITQQKGRVSIDRTSAPSTPQKQDPSRISMDVRPSPITPTKNDLTRMSMDQRPTSSPQVTPTKSLWGMTSRSFGLAQGSPLSLSALSSKLVDATKKIGEETSSLASKMNSLYQSPQQSPQTGSAVSRMSMDSRSDSMTRSPSIGVLSPPLSKSTSMPAISSFSTDTSTRRNSLSKVPTLFTRHDPITRLTFPLISLPQPPQTNTSSIDLGFTGIQLSLSPQQSHNPDCLPRRLLQTQPTSVSRNSQIQRILLLGLMITVLYTSEVNDKEIVRTKVLQLFEKLRTYEMNRESEALLRFIPKLLGDFFEPDQILPLLYQEYLGPKTRPAVVALSLSAHLPGAFIKDLTNPNNPFYKFGEWLRVGMETLAMKRPLGLAVYGLLNLFVSACLCDGHHHHASFLEIGAVVPQTPDDFVFAELFLYYGVCFYSFLKVHIPDQIPTLHKVLDQLLQIETKESEAWKEWITMLKQLMPKYDAICTETETTSTTTTQLLDFF